MVDVPKNLLGEFIDAAVQDRPRADRLLSTYPEVLEARWIHGETPLHFLAVEDFAEAVQFLAERGADVNTPNEFGDPPLVDVAALGNDSVAEILLRFGADPNATSPARDNVLHCAVRSGNARLVALLLEAAANPHYTTGLGEGVFDALPASQKEREEVIAVLARYGIKPGEQPGR